MYATGSALGMYVRCGLGSGYERNLLPKNLTHMPSVAYIQSRAQAITTLFVCVDNVSLVLKLHSLPRNELSQKAPKEKQSVYLESHG